MRPGRPGAGYAGEGEHPALDLLQSLQSHLGGPLTEEVRRILSGTDALVVLDEAYMDFWDQSLLGEVEEHDNLIILRTCSKMLGMAALRLGFAVANSPLDRSAAGGEVPL